MAGRRPQRPQAAALVQTPRVKDAEAQRAFDALKNAVQDLQVRRSNEAKVVTGSRSGGSALESLLEVLAELGIITDDTTA